ncbi:MAG: DNA replication complex GINS family protein [Candidatus Aenigmarchaeota archaeon]|nr:DNA replication complex GINS family protein [Candidatus Aenigmarchaeota archaeon]
MLTYESIRKIIDEEKESPNLTNIPEDFFTQAKAYLAKKSSVDKDDWRLESAKRRLQDIIDIREKKIVNMALYAARSKTTQENLTPEETVFFNSLLNTIKGFRKDVDSIIEIKDDLVVLKEDIEEFVGINMKNYGPYKAGDVATLPKQNAELLVNKGIAERIQSK